MHSDIYHMKVGGGRRVVLPSDVCRALGLEIGGTAVLHVEQHRITLRSVDRTVSHFRALMAKQIPPGVSLVDELIADRERDAGRE